MRAVIRITLTGSNGFSKSIDLDITRELTAHWVGFANASIPNHLKVDYVIVHDSVEVTLPATGIFEDLR